MTILLPVSEKPHAMHRPRRRDNDHPRRHRPHMAHYFLKIIAGKGPIVKHKFIISHLYGDSGFDGADLEKLL